MADYDLVVRGGTVVTAVDTGGQFVARAPYDLIRPRGVLPDGFDASAFA